MPLIDHLEDYLQLDPDTGCMEWQRYCDPAGYGRVRTRGESRYVHREVYEKHHGPVQVGLVVRHSCDNPPCGNLEHLEVGTKADNARDRDIRGRSGTTTHGRYIGYKRDRPSKLEQRKFTNAQVIEIRKRYEAGAFKKALAREFGVTDSAIRKIVTFRTYREVVVT